MFGKMRMNILIGRHLDGSRRSWHREKKCWEIIYHQLFVTIMIQFQLHDDDNNLELSFMAEVHMRHFLQSAWGPIGTGLTLVQLIEYWSQQPREELELELFMKDSTWIWHLSEGPELNIDYICGVRAWVRLMVFFLMALGGTCRAEPEKESYAMSAQDGLAGGWTCRLCNVEAWWRYIWGLYRVVDHDYWW